MKCPQCDLDEPEVHFELLMIICFVFLASSRHKFISDPSMLSITGQKVGRGFAAQTHRHSRQVQAGAFADEEQGAGHENVAGQTVRPGERKARNGGASEMIRTYHWKDSRCSDEVEPIIESDDCQRSRRKTTAAGRKRKRYFETPKNVMCSCVVGKISKRK